MKKIRITSASLANTKAGFILKGITADKQAVTLFIRRGVAMDCGFLMPASFIGKTIECEVNAEATATGMHFIESLSSTNGSGIALAEQAIATEYGKQAFAEVKKGVSTPAAQKPAEEHEDSIEFEETVDTPAEQQ